MGALITGNRVAASLAPPDTLSCLQDLERLAPKIGMADTRVYVHIISTDRQDREVLRAQERAVPGAELHASLRTPDADAPALAARLTETLPPGPFTVV